MQKRTHWPNDYTRPSGNKKTAQEDITSKCPHPHEGNVLRHEYKMSVQPRSFSSPFIQRTSLRQKTKNEQGFKYTHAQLIPRLHCHIANNRPSLEEKKQAYTSACALISIHRFHIFHFKQEAEKLRQPPKQPLSVRPTRHAYPPKPLRAGLPSFPLPSGIRPAPAFLPFRGCKNIHSCA